MATYLRDEQIENITIDAELLTLIDRELIRLARNLPEYNPDPDAEQGVFLVYTIRFDQKGYRVFTIQDLLAYFNQAQEVERIIIQIETAESLKTNRNVGTYLDLKLDKNQASFLTVSSDDESWMNGAFSSVKESLVKKINKNSLVRNVWVELLIQLFGVLGGFVFSLWGATKISPSLSIENSFLISFLLILLIFSNLWAQIGFRLKSLLTYTFPAINFHRPDKDRYHWLYQALVGGVVATIAVYFLGGIFEFMGEALGVLVGKDA